MDVVVTSSQERLVTENRFGTEHSQDISQPLTCTSNDEEMVTKGAPSSNTDVHVDSSNNDKNDGSSLNAHKYPSSGPHAPLTPFSIRDILGWGPDSQPAMDSKLTTAKEEIEMEKMDSDKPVSSSPAGDIPILSIPFPPRASSIDTSVRCSEEPLNLSLSKKRSNDDDSWLTAQHKTSSKNGNFPSSTNKRLKLLLDKPTDKNWAKSRNVLLPNDVIIPTFKSFHTKKDKDTPKNGILKAGTTNTKCKGKTKRVKDATKEESIQPLNLILDLSGKGSLREEHSASPTSTDTENDTSSSGSSKRKKARTTFTGKQIYEMERKFEVKKYLSSNERTEMARIINVTETQVKIWFQNRRTKWKKLDNISNAAAAEHKVTKVPSAKGGGGGGAGSGNRDKNASHSIRKVRKGTEGVTGSSENLSNGGGGARGKKKKSLKVKAPPCTETYEYSPSFEDHSNGSILTQEGAFSESTTSEYGSKASSPPNGDDLMPFYQSHQRHLGSLPIPQGANVTTTPLLGNESAVKFVEELFRAEISPVELPPQTIHKVQSAPNNQTETDAEEVKAVGLETPELEKSERKAHDGCYDTLKEGEEDNCDHSQVVQEEVVDGTSREN